MVCVAKDHLVALPCHGQGQHNITQDNFCQHFSDQNLDTYGAMTLCQDQGLLLCFQTNPPTCHCESWVQPSVFLLPTAPGLGSVGWQCGQGKGSSCFSVQAQPDQNSVRAKVRTLTSAFLTQSKQSALGLP